MKQPVSGALLAGIFERYQSRAWLAVDRQVEGKEAEHLGIFAVARAYYVVYNACLAAAKICGIPLDRYRTANSDLERKDAIPHVQLPVLASDLIKAFYPPPTLQGPYPRAQRAFTISRELQKHRKDADYMGGLEGMESALAGELIGSAKNLVAEVWEYAKDYVND